MRKLKLQIQISVDGFIAGKNGEMDWMVWDWDEQLKEYVSNLTKHVDTILLGRKLAEGFIPSWTSMLEKPETANDFAKAMVETPKVVFTKTMEKSNWPFTELAKGDLTAEVSKIKANAGKDMIVYGGGTFVSSLIKAGLIDDYFLFVNPVALGDGMPIFNKIKANHKLVLKALKSFECGIVVLHYQG